MTYHSWCQRFLIAGIISLLTLFLSVTVALAEGDEVKTTAVYTGAMRLLTKGINGITDGTSSVGAANSDLSCIVIGSRATDLISDDTNGKQDMFFKQGLNTEWQRLALSSYDTIPLGISEDCRFIVFRRDETSGNSTGQNLYLYDRNDSSETLVSRAKDGSKAGRAVNAWITPNGAYIFFSSYASNILETDTNGNRSDVYRYEVATQKIIVVSVNNDNQQANLGSQNPFSIDGNTVVFSSSGWYMPGGNAGYRHVYLRNISEGTTIKVTSGLPDKGSSGIEYGYMPIAITGDNGVVLISRSEVGIGGARFFLYSIPNQVVHELNIGLYGSVFSTLSGDGSTIFSVQHFDGANGPYAYLCIYAIATATRECPKPSSGSANFGTVIPSFDGKKAFFSSNDHTWIGSQLKRDELDVFYWDRTQVASISGRVTGDNDEPLGNMVINYDDGRSVKPNSKGMYTITNIFDGQHIITPTLAGKTFYPPNATVTVPPSKREVNFSTKQLNKSVVVFIPGMAGSTLLLKESNKQLWPSPFWDDKKQLSLKSGSKNIYTGYPIEKYGLNVYGTFLETLEDEYNKYDTVVGSYVDPDLRLLAGCDRAQNNASLFVFPWDWRYGIADGNDPQTVLSPNNVELLHEFVQCIQRIHEGQDVKITIIAHSMGGMLATQYLLKHPSDHNIDTVISVGTPYLGAPEAIASLLAGKFHDWLITPSNAKELLEYFPGAHQLLPSQKYFELSTMAPFVIYDPYSLQICNPTCSPDIPVNYSNFQSALRNKYRSPAESDIYRTSVDFVANNEAVFYNQAFTDWRHEDWSNNTLKSVKYYILYGERDGADTIGQVKNKAIQYTGFETDVVDVPNQYTYVYVLGDKTVPVVSASRIGGGANFNGNADLYRFKQRPDEKSFKHMDLLSNVRIQVCIFSIINGNAEACEKDEIVPASSRKDGTARYIKLWGVTSLRITDGISTTTELITSTLSLEALFPDVTLYFMGENAVSIILPGDSSYTIDANSDEYLEVEVMKNGSTSRLIRYVDVPVENGVSFSINSAPANLAEVLIDTDSDHTPDMRLQPSVMLSGNEINDTIAPTVTITVDSQQQTVTISASDDLSGVSRIFYSLNGTDYFWYAQPFPLPIDVYAIYVQAEDKVGNVSVLVTKEVRNRSIFLPLIQR